MQRQRQLGQPRRRRDRPRGGRAAARRGRGRGRGGLGALLGAAERRRLAEQRARRGGAARRVRDRAAVRHVRPLLRARRERGRAPLALAAAAGARHEQHLRDRHRRERRLLALPAAEGLGRARRAVRAPVLLRDAQRAAARRVPTRLRALLLAPVAEQRLVLGRRARVRHHQLPRVGLRAVLERGRRPRPEVPLRLVDRAVAVDVDAAPRRAELLGAALDVLGRRRDRLRGALRFLVARTQPLRHARLGRRLALLGRLLRALLGRLGVRAHARVEFVIGLALALPDPLEEVLPADRVQDLVAQPALHGVRHRKAALPLWLCACTHKRQARLAPTTRRPPRATRARLNGSRAEELANAAPAAARVAVERVAVRRARPPRARAVAASRRARRRIRVRSVAGARDSPAKYAELVRWYEAHARQSEIPEDLGRWGVTYREYVQLRPSSSRPSRATAARAARRRLRERGRRGLAAPRARRAAAARGRPHRRVVRQRHHPRRARRRARGAAARRGRRRAHAVRRRLGQPDGLGAARAVRRDALRIPRGARALRARAAPRVGGGVARPLVRRDGGDHASGRARLCRQHRAARPRGRGRMVARRRRVRRLWVGRRPRERARAASALSSTDRRVGRAQLTSAAFDEAAFWRPGPSASGIHNDEPRKIRAYAMGPVRLQARRTSRGELPPSRALETSRSAPVGLAVGAGSGLARRGGRGVGSAPARAPATPWAASRSWARRSGSASARRSGWGPPRGAVLVATACAGLSSVDLDRRQRLHEPVRDVRQQRVRREACARDPRDPGESLRARARARADASEREGASKRASSPAARRAARTLRGLDVVVHRLPRGVLARDGVRPRLGLLADDGDRGRGRVERAVRLGLRLERMRVGLRDRLVALGVGEVDVVARVLLELDRRLVRAAARDVGEREVADLRAPTSGDGGKRRRGDEFERGARSLGAQERRLLTCVSAPACRPASSRCRRRASRRTARACRPRR